MEIGIGVPSLGQTRVLSRVGLITTRETVPVAAGIMPEVAHPDNEIHVIVTYSNIFGERFETITVFPKVHGSRLPTGPERHLLRRLGDRA